MENELHIVIKWSGKEYNISNLSESDTVQSLKNAIHKETGVRPERQKLLNLKLKGYCSFYIMYAINTEVLFQNNLTLIHF